MQHTPARAGGEGAGRGGGRGRGTSRCGRGAPGGRGGGRGGQRGCARSRRPCARAAPPRSPAPPSCRPLQVRGSSVAPARTRMEVQGAGCKGKDGVWRVEGGVSLPASARSSVTDCEALEREEAGEAGVGEEGVGECGCGKT
eukprot:28828-Rhodomonas_salina.1